jgi:hypothetical protein
MPSTPSDRLGLAAPDAADGIIDSGPAHLQAIIDQLDDKVGMVKLADLAPTAGIIDFTSIPDDFRHLRIEACLRIDSTTGVPITQWGAMRFNADGSLLYSSDASKEEAAVAPATIQSNAIRLARLPNVPDESTAGGMAAMTIDILGYKETTFPKLWLAKAGVYPGAGRDFQNWSASGVWDSNAAITSVQLSGANQAPGTNTWNSRNLDAISFATLYGIV